MKIEVGKYYVTRSGEKVGPMLSYGRTAYGYEALRSNASLWRSSDGLSYPDRSISDDPSQDIISEYQAHKHSAVVTNRIITHGTWSPRGTKPKTQYVYEVQFDLDANGHPDWSTATVRGK